MVDSFQKAADAVVAGGPFDLTEDKESSFLISAQHTCS